MSSFTAKKINISSINNGNRYVDGDGINAEAINAPIEAALLLQNLATNAPDISQANMIGNPSVEIGGTSDNPRFVFKNLKGERGEKGATGERGASGTSAVLENENHNSDKDGYTQKFVNSNFSNPNLLINGDFSVNQRGKETYSGNNVFCVDRWKLQEDSLIFNVKTKTLTNKNPSTTCYMLQKFESYDEEKIKGKTVTITLSSLNETNSVKINIPKSPESNTTIENKVVRVSGAIAYLYSYSNGNIGFVIGIPANSSVSLDYVKLEIGSVATPLVPRPYAEELALCQRYYSEVNSNCVFACRGMSETTFAFTIPLPTTQRVSGTISIDDLVLCLHNTSYELTDVKIQSTVNGNNGKTITITSDTLLGLGYRHTASVYSTKSIILDAEIY